MTKIQIAARTDSGRIRSLNEDNFVVATDLKAGVWNRLSPEPFDLGDFGALFMIADGMGGSEGGEVASEIAVSSVQKTFSGLTELPDSELAITEFLKTSILLAHKKILEHVTEQPSRKGMGTTAIVGWLLEDRLYLAWSGDSRAYHWRSESGLKMISSDHSLVWEEVLKGAITPEQARVHPQSHIITQSLGDEKLEPVPDVAVEKVYADSKILYCSDGLNGMISDSAIAELLMAENSPSETCVQLIDAANEHGGEDNTTVVLIDVKETASQNIQQNEIVAPTQALKKNGTRKWWQFW